MLSCTTLRLTKSVVGNNMKLLSRKVNFASKEVDMEMKEHPFKDERDRQINLSTEHHALEFVNARIQIFTIACFLKKNTVRKGSFSLAARQNCFISMKNTTISRISLHWRWYGNHRFCYASALPPERRMPKTTA